MAMSYSSLKSDIQAFTEDDGTEFTDELDGIIERAEIRVSKDLNTDGLIVIETGTLTASTHTLDKPAGTIAVRHFNLVNGTARPILEFRTLSFCNDYWPNRATTGTPKYYANWDDDTWIVVPTPDDAYAYEIETEQRIVGLSDATTTTWVTDNAPGLLLAACMSEAASYHKNETQKERWEAEYATRLASAAAEVARIRSDATSALR